MDSVTVDLTALPDDSLHLGALLDPIVPERDRDARARNAGTIGDELLTSLGGRYHGQAIHS
jgi:alanine racemase